MTKGVDYKKWGVSRQLLTTINKAKRAEIRAVFDCNLNSNTKGVAGVVK